MYVVCYNGGRIRRDEGNCSGIDYGQWPIIIKKTRWGDERERAMEGGWRRKATVGRLRLDVCNVLNHATPAPSRLVYPGRRELKAVRKRLSAQVRVGAAMRLERRRVALLVVVAAQSATAHDIPLAIAAAPPSRRVGVVERKRLVATRRSRRRVQKRTGSCRWQVGRRRRTEVVDVAVSIQFCTAGG